MQPLKLPEFDYKIEGNRIFCLIRKKWIVLTPEEWVRQHFVNLLIEHLHYPKGLFRLENTLQYFKNKKRSDIMILDREGHVFLLVECKAPSVEIGQTVVSQISEYNKILNANFLAITNGLTHFFWEREDSGYHQMKNYPLYTS